MEEKIKRAAEIIKDADRILITAGAGMGVDSGLPDFRGKTGFWNAYPAISKLGISFSEMANPYWFKKKPELAWAFYGHRLNLYRETVPHSGFDQLREICSMKDDDYFVFTSNVDGHFQKAGFSEEKVYECHGSINHFQCAENCCDKIWPADSGRININEEEFKAVRPLPQCRYCNALSRPNILMFNDWSWNEKRSSVQSQSLSSWLHQFDNRKKTAIIELGAGVAVPTVRMFSESILKSFNADLIRINPRDFKVPGNSVSLETGSKTAVQKVYRLLKTY